MNKEFYYCKYWEHIYFGEYEMCVSDIILSNDKKMAQIHIIIMKNGKVVRGISSLSLEKFENTIRELIRNGIDAKNNLLDKGTIKIWYYNMDDSQINSKDVPLRIAVTFTSCAEDIPVEIYNGFRRDIYDYLQGFLKGLVL